MKKFLLALSLLAVGSNHCFTVKIGQAEALMGAATIIGAYGVYAFVNNQTDQELLDNSKAMIAEALDEYGQILDFLDKHTLCSQESLGIFAQLPNVTEPITPTLLKFRKQVAALEKRIDSHKRKGNFTLAEDLKQVFQELIALLPRLAHAECALKLNKGYISLSKNFPKLTQTYLEQLDQLQDHAPLILPSSDERYPITSYLGILNEDINYLEYQVTGLPNQWELTIKTKELITKLKQIEGIFLHHEQYHEERKQNTFHNNLMHWLSAAKDKVRNAFIYITSKINP